MSHVRFLFLPLLLLVGIQAVCSGTDRNAGKKDSIFARVESFLAGSDDDSLRTVSEAIFIILQEMTALLWPAGFTNRESAEETISA